MRAIRRSYQLLGVALLVSLLLVLVPSPTSAQGAGHGGGVAGQSARESARSSSGFGWGIELRSTGIGPCRPSTPAPCSGFVYNTSCPAPGQARLTRIRTYMGAFGTAYVGFRLRAKLIERGRPASTVPWSTPDVEHFLGRRGVTERLMDTRNISGPVDVTTQWDIQVEYRFDRSGGLADVVRVRRGGPVNLHCK